MKKQVEKQEGMILLVLTSENAEDQVFLRAAHNLVFGDAPQSLKSIALEIKPVILTSEGKPEAVRGIDRVPGDESESEIKQTDPGQGPVCNKCKSPSTIIKRNNADTGDLVECLSCGVMEPYEGESHAG
jgi:hypothetical protein